MIKSLIKKIAVFAKGSLNNLFDRYWDNKLGIKTQGIHPSAADSEFGDNVECNPTGYRLLLKVLHSLPKEKIDSEVFVDYGCGKGRVICLFAQKPFRKIIGVEVSQTWADHSSHNVSSLRINRANEVKIVKEDAVNFDPIEGTVFYFFNPFGAGTFKMVLDKIHTSLQLNHRPILIIYYNTVCKYIIDKEPWLKQQKVIHRDLYGNPAIITYKNLT